MSRHTLLSVLPDGRVAEVVMGWDPPTSSFFATAFIDGEIAYSSLNEADAFASGLDFLRAKLAARGVVVPTEMLEELELDRIVDDGERRAQHGSG